MGVAGMSTDSLDTGRARERSSRGRFVRSAWVLLPLSLTFVIAAWQLILDVSGGQSLLVPKPSQIASAFVTSVTRNPTGPGSLAQAAWSTYSAALVAFGIAAILGIIVAALAAESSLVERLMLPYITAFQTVPRIAIAPLILIWFGNGISSKVLMATLVAFFPVVVNALAGLKATPTGRRELMRYLGASWWQTYRYVRLPGAMPYIFSGLEVALVFSILGVVVTEFVGSTSGLGIIILQSHFSLDVAGVFSVFVVLVVVGLALRGALMLVRRRVLFWAETQNMDSM